MPHLEHFHKRYPKIRFNIINRTSPETLQLLQEGAIDFGIISFPKKRDHLKCDELLTIQDVIVAGKDQYSELRGVQTVKTISAYPLISLEKDNVTHRYLERFFTSQGIVLQPEIEISSLDFLVNMVRMGLGLGLGIKNFIEHELYQGTLREIALEPPIPPRKVGIVRLKGMPLSTAAKAFVDSLVAYHGSAHLQDG